MPHLTRLMGEQIGRAQGLAVVIENRPGAGTVIGTEAVARSAPDGTTLLITSPPFVINPHLRRVNYDPQTSFEPICTLAVTPTMIVVSGGSPHRTVRNARAPRQDQNDLRAISGYCTGGRGIAGRTCDLGGCRLPNGCRDMLKPDACAHSRSHHRHASRRCQSSPSEPSPGRDSVPRIRFRTCLIRLAPNRVK